MRSARAGADRPAACPSRALGIYSKVKEKCQGERLPKHQAPLLGPAPPPPPGPPPALPSLPSPAPHWLPLPLSKPRRSRLLQDDKGGEGGAQAPTPMSPVIEGLPYLRFLGPSCARRERMAVVARLVYLPPPTSCSQGRGGVAGDGEAWSLSLSPGPPGQSVRVGNAGVRRGCGGGDLPLVGGKVSTGQGDPPSWTGLTWRWTIPGILGRDWEPSAPQGWPADTSAGAQRSPLQSASGPSVLTAAATRVEGRGWRKKL